jgi:transcriptional regulator with XRE-family HTH domain
LGLFFVSTFSDKLKKLRGSLTQAEFARRVGLAQNSYHRYESGERIPDIDVLSKLASRLNVSTDWLLGLEDGEGIPPTVAMPNAVFEHHDPNDAYCPACGQKDKTIASQAESIVNLTRSLDALTHEKK